MTIEGHFVCVCWRGGGGLVRRGETMVEPRAGPEGAGRQCVRLKMTWARQRRGMHGTGGVPLA
jgi:hypothetical protein